VRAVVADYRQPVLHGELAAARELLAAAGISATIEHNASGLSPALDGLLAWAVREGITNVIRHSRAGQCTISINRLDGRVRVEVVDDGRGAAPEIMASGSGLAGLAERAAVHGGTLRAGPLPDHGFSLVLDVPESAEGSRS
jgi:two-component system sensor histidine kinase DesK